MNAVVANDGGAPAHVATVHTGAWRGFALEVVSISADGARRRANSDARLSSATSGVFAAADGVSTLPGSPGAARRCLDYLAAELRQAGPLDAASVAAVIRHVNGRLFAEGRARLSGLEPGACTLDGVALADDALIVFHVGDGAVWVGGADGMRAMTIAQCAAAPSARDPGATTKRLAAAVGARPMLNPETTATTLPLPGAALIATDGALRADDLLEHPWFRHAAPSSSLAARLEEMAGAELPDDMTVIAVRWTRD